MSCRSLPGAGAGLSRGTISSSDDIGGIIVLAIDIGLLKLKEAGTIDMRLSLELIILYGLWGEKKQDKTRIEKPLTRMGRIFRLIKAANHGTE